MLENNIVINCVMAKTPRGCLFFSFLFFFFRYHFFSLYRETPVPLHFHSNYNLDKKKYKYFMWNNSILTKFIKEERTLILNPYIKLVDGVSF